MMKKLFFVFFISILFCQCTSSDKIPTGILTIDQMKGTVWDLIKAGEIALNDTVRNKTISLKDDETMLFQKVFLLHHTDRNTFYKSYDYYFANPDKNSILMDSVNAVATRERSDMYSRPLNTKPVIRPKRPLNNIHIKRPAE